MKFTVKGQTVLVDPQDAHLFEIHGWTISLNGYVSGNARGPGARKAKKVYLHRLILNARPGELVDHANRNKLDNRRENLRLCTKAQNAANAKKRGDARTSRFKGVCYCKMTGRWIASIGNDWIGRFPTEEAASVAYRSAAKARFGEFYREDTECR